MAHASVCCCERRKGLNRNGNMGYRVIGHIGSTSVFGLGGSPTNPKTEVLPMCPMTRYPMLPFLLSPFRRSQQQTLAWAIAALAEVAHATSFAVAGHLAVQLG